VVPFPRDDVTLRAVAVGADGRAAVSGSKGTFGVSADGGQTWRLAPVAGAEALDLRGLAITGRGATVLMSAGDAAAGQAKLFRTQDGGASWTTAYETRVAGGFFDTVRFWDARRGLVLGDPVDGQWFLLETRDGGRNWARVAAKMPPLLAGEAAFAASNSALILGPRGQAWIVSGGGPRGRVFASQDFGRTWRVAETPIAGGPTSGVFGGLALGGGRGVVVGGDHKDELRAGTGISATADGGSAWTAPAATGASRLLESVARRDDRTLIAVGPRGTSVSRDLGRTWAQVDAEAFHAVACGGGDSHGGLCVAVGGKGRVAVWEDPPSAR
jgi:photosystem II stability/assembly factor-like uncharacterized protein